MKILVGILTVSDRCARGEAEDRSGPLLCRSVEGRGWLCADRRIVSDDPEAIRKLLIEWCDERRYPLVLTTGGTGIGPRDGTPEVTRSLLEKELPGVAEMMRHEGLKHTPFASLSRGVAGVRKQTLILNLPGSPKGAEESFEAAALVIPHLLETLVGEAHGIDAHEETGCHAVEEKLKLADCGGHTNAHSNPTAQARREDGVMTPVREAMAAIREQVGVLPAETVPLSEAVDRILAESIIAPDDLPPFENSAMDGYAVRVADVAGASPENPVELAVQEKIPAGKGSLDPLESGKAARIMTGAPVPPGADAVIMQELTHSDGNGRVKIFRGVKPGENIRKKGEDVAAGSALLEAGTRLRPYEIALLAASGFPRVRVIRKLRVAVVATGDELMDVSEAPLPGKIRNANGPGLVSCLKRWGIEPLDFGIVRDDPSEIEAVFQKALRLGDALLVSGGVSVGEFDFTRRVLRRMGVKEILWRVAMKPGKPFYFGLYENVKPVFGLPGNPVSVLVCVEELVRPAFEKMQGCASRHPSYHLQGRVLNDYHKPGDRLQFVFCQAASEENGFTLTVIRPQGSHMMRMATRANALAVAPEGVAHIRAGDLLPFRWLK